MMYVMYVYVMYAQVLECPSVHAARRLKDLDSLFVIY
jgi:hypothetical protein